MWRIIFDRKQLLAIEAWLAVPVLLALAVQVGVGSYYRRGEGELDRRGAWAVLLPDLETQTAASRAELSALSLSREQYASRLEALGKEFNSTAKKVGFRVDSMSVDKSETDEGVTIFRVTLTGAGDIAATARFLYTLQTNECCMSVNTARLAPQLGQANGQWDVNILFQFSALALEPKR